jgi:hypothetical protein
VAVGLEHQCVEFIAAVLFLLQADFALALAQGVDHLVLEDAHQPGLELRAVAKRLGPGQGGQQRFRDGVLGPGVVAQLQACVPQQVAAVPGQLTFDGHGGSL